MSTGKNTVGFPTSNDIYIEVDSKKVAVVQSYTAHSTKTSEAVKAFGEEEPVATIAGQRTHVIELTRLYATDAAVKDGLNFHELSDFDLVICKPDGRIVYSGCQWSDIRETGALGAMVVEKVTVVAKKRTVESAKKSTPPIGPIKVYS